MCYGFALMEYVKDTTIIDMVINLKMDNDELSS